MSPEDDQKRFKHLKSPTPEAIVSESDPPLTAGSRVLRDPELAVIVQDALCYFEGVRYHMLAWCVMPNHVHAVFQPLASYKVDDILHSWKSFTANRINATLGETGARWERESFDHLVRTPSDLDRFIEYVEQNPVAARLVEAPEDWPFSSAGVRWEKAEVQFVDPQSTPFEHPRTRGELTHLYKDCGCYFVTFRLKDAVVDR